VKKIDPSDIKNIIEYEKVRIPFRSKIIGMKNTRRLKVGELITFTFENRHTVVFQIEEMMRVERIVDDAKIMNEIETYNELIPRDDELSATLFVEVDEQAKVKPVLDSLVGLNKDSVFLDVAGKSIPAVFEEGHATDDRISAVQYVRFKLSREDAETFNDPTNPARIVIRHKNYNATSDITSETRKALIGDLAQHSVNVWN